MPSEPLTRGTLSEEWTQSVGVRDPAYLDRRLQRDGLSPDDLVAILQSPPHMDVHQFHMIQDWLQASPAITDTGNVPPTPPVSFAELWRPVADGAMDQLLKELPGEVVDYFGLHEPEGQQKDGVRAALLGALVGELSRIGEAVLWRELNERRTPDQVVFAHLGDSGQKPRTIRRRIYCEVLEEQRATALSGLVAKYPVLQSHLSTATTQWMTNSRALLTRVFDDRSLLAGAFSLRPTARVSGLELGISDPHRGGQSAAILAFAASPAAADRRYVVYKPKDLEIDKAFQHLLGELRPPRSGDAPLRSAAVVACAGYGYMEFIPHRVCTSDEQLGEFYRNAGRLTAVLYILGGTDCHYENLIACGSQLHLVDAETLLAGRFNYDANDLNARVANSVTALGILPQWYVFGRRRVVRDLSALGIEPPERESQSVRGWVDINTDGMIIGDTERASLVPASLPVGPGSRNRLGDFIDDFCGGFADELASVARRKEDWLDDDGHLARFAGMSRRVVVRPTWIYSWLRRRQLEPSSLQSWRSQRLVLEVLSRPYLVDSGRPKDWPLFGAEAAQLAMMDVPFFEIPVDATDLALADGSVIAGSVQIPGRHTARLKIEQLDEASVDFQVELIRGASLAKSRFLVPAPQIPGATRSADDDPARLDGLAEADSIGRQLLEASIDSGQNVDWLGIDIMDDLERFKFGPLGPSLYGGKMGIAIFLAALSARGLGRSGDYRHLAVRVCSDVSERLLNATAAEQARWWRDTPLGLAGCGGVLLALLQLTELLPELELRDGISALLGSCSGHILDEDSRLDVVFGCAGLIGPLLRLGSEEALSLAARAGGVLLKRQHASGGWITTEDVPEPLTGFSHGASGIAAALAALHAVFGTADYRVAVQHALLCERRTFDADERDSPDPGPRRTRDPRFRLSWCHGNPGIALSRMCITKRPVPDWDVDGEISSALASASAKASKPLSDSVCCGQFGRAAILRLGAHDLGEPRWLGAAHAIEREVLDAKQRSGFYSAVNSYGLFSGVSGIGLALLDGLTGDQAGAAILPAVLSAGLYGAPENAVAAGAG